MALPATPPISVPAAAQQRLLRLLDDAPLGARHSALWLLATGGPLLDGAAIFCLGVALPLVARAWGLAAGRVGLVGAAAVLGAVAGALLGGPAADRWGRRRLMLADMAVLAAGAALSALAPGPVELFLGQLLVGVGIGSDFPVGAAYLAEWMPRRRRSRLMVAAIAGHSAGLLLAAAVLVAVLSLTADPRAWRLFLALPGLVAGLFLLARLAAPESVRWLLGRGENAAAARALGRVLPEDGKHAEALADACGKAVHVAALDHAAAAPPGFAALFHPALRRRTLLVSVPWFLLDVATCGAGLFTPVILGALHTPVDPHAGPLAADFAAARGSSLLDLVLLAGFIAALWAVPRFGRLRMQQLGFLGMAAGLLVLLAATRLPGGAAAHVPLVFAGFVVFNLLMTAGPNVTTYTLAPELFPTPLRASAGGLAAGAARAGATLGVLLLPVVQARCGIARRAGRPGRRQPAGPGRHRRLRPGGARGRAPGGAPAALRARRRNRLTPREGP